MAAKKDAVTLWIEMEQRVAEAMSWSTKQDIGLSRERGKELAAAVESTARFEDLDAFWREWVESIEATYEEG